MHIPAATYRVQFNKDFTLTDLDAIIDYLHALGISTIYASPITCAEPGSLHGYDVTDPHRLNPEIGTMEQFKQVNVKLNERGMGWIQDIVPNHMAFSIHNYRLMDVLERGPASPYYNYFDIDWDHSDSELHGKLMTPVLPNDLVTCLQKNEIQLQFSGSDGFTIVYADNRYPLSVSALPSLITRGTSDKNLNREISSYLEVAGRSEGWADWQAAKQQLLSKIAHYENEVTQCLATINGDPELLQQLLQEQYYVFTHYGDTAGRINYRRFFTVNSLICLNMENEATFRDYHRWLLSLYRDDYIQGLRIDHLDGLANPAQYLQRLRNLFGEDCYIIVEKILEAEEQLPSGWPVQGTSGYEFLAQINRLLTRKEGAEKLQQQYRQIENIIYQQTVWDKKRLILEKHMGGEVDNLVRLFFNLAPPEARINKERFRKALIRFMVYLPVYRIYPESLPLTGYGAKIIEEVFTGRQAAIDGIEEEWSLLQKIFMPGDAVLTQLNKLQFIKRLMQFTGPATAKGVEDTTFYIYNALLSHNEVGDSPAVPSLTIGDFHTKMLERQQQNPLSLNATATHDTKRGEDARLRITVLGAMPEEWQQQVEHWRERNRSFITMLQEQPAPSSNDEYFIYQSLLAGFPENLAVTPGFVERMQNYLVKALREAKTNTNWEVPDESYEQACRSFVENILHKDHGFLSAFIPFLQKVLDYAVPFSLIQQAIKITAPGIPDIYQGCEWWDLSYVDPDNRRPVDYELRRQLLQELEQKAGTSLNAAVQWAIDHPDTAVRKLWSMHQLLQWRCQNGDVFTKGNYIPLYAGDDESRQILLAYFRQYRQKWLLVILPLDIKRIISLRSDLLLPDEAPRKWKNIFNGNIIEGEALHLPTVFAQFPIAVLQSLQE